MKTYPANLLFVTTRDVPTVPSTGRERVLGFITATLSNSFEVKTTRIHSVLERFTVGRAAQMFWIWVKGLATRSPIPLQSLVFFDGERLKYLIEQIGDPDDCAVYLDGVRTLEYARRLRKRFAHLRIVCDLDDLMSRRADELLRNGLPIRPGYLSPFMPRLLVRGFLNGPLRAVLLRYERAALARAEAELCELCQLVVLLSDHESAMLRERLRDELIERTITIEPAFLSRATRGVGVEVRRFIFVGSDLALQNQLSIDFLMGIWEDHGPSRPLHIYGRMFGAYQPIDGVTLEGFADYDSIYTDGSVALCPSFLRGGIKTKVLEALEYGILPIGTDLAFEGIQRESLLGMDEGELIKFVKDPLDRIEGAVDAAIGLRRELIRRQGAHIISAKWISAFALSDSPNRMTAAIALKTA
jgi:hypothetical protein